MTFKRTSKSLPPLRKYILKNSLVLVGLFAGVGVTLMIAVFLASGITPRLIHLNYDSIAAVTRMDSAWDALKNPGEHPERTSAEWAEQFNRALTFEEGNISEAGEYQLVKGVRELWTLTKNSLPHIDPATDKRMESYFSQIIELNEKGMFALASESNSLSQKVFIVSTLLFLLSIATALYLADHLAVKIASPLKELAETMRRKPAPGTQLNLPNPTSLEMRIFIHEMLMLWERLSNLRKLNLEEISAQRMKLEAVLSSVDDAILVLDNRDRVVHCNQGMLDLIGSKFSDVLGQPWRDLSSLGENYLALRELLKPGISSDQTVDLESRGRKRVFSGRSRPFYGNKQEQLGSLYLLHDITEIRQKDRLKTEFIGVLSHELKTPLQSLGTASELLLGRKGAMEAEDRLLVETIYEDTRRIRAVANEFVQVGMVDLHSLRLKIEKVPMDAFLQQWIQPFQVLAKDRNVRVEFLKEGSEIIYGQIDTIKFPWAISNLISNAVRVSPPESKVTVYLTDRESRVDIEVRDDGPGVSSEVQKKMFDPAFQRSAGSSGFLGLGLTITKEVVEAHEGRIEYFKRLPQGSVFRISLPLPS